MRQPPRKVFRKLSAVAAAATAGFLGNHFHGLAAADDRAVIAPAALRHLKLDTALPAYKLVSRFDRLHFIPFLSFETRSVSVNDLFLSRFPGKTYCIRKGTDTESFTRHLCMEPHRFGILRPHINETLSEPPGLQQGAMPPGPIGCTWKRVRLPHLERRLP